MTARRSRTVSSRAPTRSSALRQCILLAPRLGLSPGSTCPHRWRMRLLAGLVPHLPLRPSPATPRVPSSRSLALWQHPPRGDLQDRAHHAASLAGQEIPGHRARDAGHGAVGWMHRRGRGPARHHRPDQGGRHHRTRRVRPRPDWERGRLAWNFFACARGYRARGLLSGDAACDAAVAMSGF